MHVPPSASLVFVIVSSCFMSLTTQAQIGYTPQQMEAKFGKPKFTKNFGTKSCDAIYPLTSETAPFLVSMGARDVNVTYYDGKAETFSGGGNFYDKAEAAGASLIVLTLVTT